MRENGRVRYELIKKKKKTRNKITKIYISQPRTKLPNNKKEDEMSLNVLDKP